MNKIIKVLAVVVLIIALYPLFFWVQNPEFTKMQIFVKFWYIYLSGILLSVLFVYLDNITKSLYCELVISHKSNGEKRFTKCDYGYFLERGKWEAIVINFRPFKKSLWIYRDIKYKLEWPCSCA